MTRYFVFGNIWLLVALALFLGRSFARSEPHMVSFTPWGGWMYPQTYHALNIFCLVLAAVWFLLAIVSCWGSSTARR